VDFTLQNERRRQTFLALPQPQSGFYFTKFGDKDIILEYNNKKIPLSRPDFRTDYVIIQKRDGSLNSTIGEVTLSDVTLPDVSLPTTEIKDVKIEATMPDWEIK